MITIWPLYGSKKEGRSQGGFPPLSTKGIHRYGEKFFERHHAFIRIGWWYVCREVPFRCGGFNRALY